MDLVVEPPLAAAEAERLDQALPFGLPSILRDFYVTASANATCKFGWDPQGAHEAALAQAIGGSKSLYGGPCLCPASQAVQEQEHLSALAEVFEDIGDAPALARARLLRRSAPFIHVATGDAIVLDVAANPANPPVLYVPYAEPEPPAILLSKSGEHFLMAWEQIGYAGPEIWLLDPFLGVDGEPTIQGNSARAVAWRAFLRELGLPCAL